MTRHSSFGSGSCRLSMRTSLALRVALQAAAVLLVAVCLASAAAGADVPIAAEDVNLNSYPNPDNFTFQAGAGNTGSLVLAPDAGNPTALQGSITLERDSRILFSGNLGPTSLLASGTSGLDLDTSLYGLLLQNNQTVSGAPMTTPLNVTFGDQAGGGTFAAGTLGTIYFRGSTANPMVQQTILHLNGGTSNANGSTVTFDFYGGGLSIERAESLPEFALMVGAFGASVILPVDGTTIGNGFAYMVDDAEGVWTNTGGMFILGDLTPGAIVPADVTYNGGLTYSGTNFIDDEGREWGRATIIVGSGTFAFSDGVFSTTDALAIGGGRNFYTGQSDPTVFATLVVASQADLDNMTVDKNLGFCGGKLDLSGLGASVDLTAFKLAAITINTGSGDPFPGGGSLLVDATAPVTIQVTGVNLLTEDGILKLERAAGAGTITLQIDCGGGIVDPTRFGGLLLPADTTVEFTTVAGSTVATGNLEGEGNVDAGGNDLEIGSNVNTTSAFTGELQNVAQLEKTGTGTTELGSGASVAPTSAEINQGQLVIQDGATFTLDGGAGTMTVNSGGILSGNGTIGGNGVLNSGGWLRPGNSIDSHTTNGNLTIQSQGGVEIEVVALPGGQTVGAPGADNDVERVTGTLTIQSGGRVHVVEDSTSVGSFKSGDRYYSLVAEGSLVGAAGVVVTEALPGVAIGRSGVEHTTLSILGDDVTGDWFWFELTRGFRVRTTNQQSAADYLTDRHDHGQLVAVYNAVDGLSSDDQPAALAALSGESLVSSQSLSLEAGLLRLRVLLSQIRPGAFPDGTMGFAGVARPQGVYRAQSCCLPTWTGWTTGYGAGGRVQGSNRTNGIDTTVGGVVTGIDRELGSAARLGLFYSYDHAHGGYHAPDASNLVDNHLFGMYLAQQLDGWYWLSTLGIGWDTYHLRRNVTVGPINESLLTRNGGWQSVLYGESGLNLGMGRWALQPYVGLEYTYLRQDELAEDLAVAPNSALVMDSMDDHALRTHLGGRLAGAFAFSGHRVFPELRTAWLHELLDDTAPLTNMRFGSLPAGAAFPVSGADLARDWCWIGTGVQYPITEYCRLYADYDVLVNARQTLHTGSGGLLVTW